MYLPWEGSHSGLVRAPAKRLTCESGFMGSNPIPSATPRDHPERQPDYQNVRTYIADAQLASD